MTKDAITALRNAEKTYHLGWGQPEYTDFLDEQLSWKSTCYIGDWSFLPDVEIAGPDALRLFAEHSINSFSNFPVGRAKHAVQCNEAGKVVSEGVLMRVGDDAYRIQGSPAPYFAQLAELAEYNVIARPIQSHQLQVAGPNALDLLSGLASEPLDEIAFMRFRKLKIAGFEVYALRQGMAGEIGFELHGPADQKDALIAALFDHGQAFGVRRLGRRTAMINHLEACFPTGAWHFLPAPGKRIDPEKAARVIAGFNFPWRFTQSLTGSFEGADVSEYYRSPIELGWGRSIAFDHDFVGREALQKELAAPVRTIATLEFDSSDMVEVYASLFENGDPFKFMDIPHQQRWVVWADAVSKNGARVGVSTVPGYSFKFRKILALAYLNAGDNVVGNRVEVLWGDPGTRQRMIGATIARAPYKRDRRK